MPIPERKKDKFSIMDRQILCQKVHQIISVTDSIADSDASAASSGGKWELT